MPNSSCDILLKCTKGMARFNLFFLFIIPLIFLQTCKHYCLSRNDKKTEQAIK